MVSAFAVLGSLFKPVSFGGLFSAAPSVALATLTLTIVEQGRGYASRECRSMVFGAVALGFYSLVVTRLLLTFKLSALRSTLAAMIVWFVIAFGLRMIVLG